MIKLAEIYKQILNENATFPSYNSLIELLQKYFLSMKVKYTEQFDDLSPIEIKEAVEHELVFDQHSTIPFLTFLKAGTITTKKYRVEKDRMKIKKACYYNSVSYMYRYKEKYPNLQLAWGIIIEDFDKFERELKDYVNDDKYKMRTSLRVILHAFCIMDGKVIDPTLTDNEPYGYEIVPESIWRKFNWKDNDSNFDGRDFCNYIYKKYEGMSKSSPIAKEVMKLI